MIPGINDAHYHNEPYLQGYTISYPSDGREPQWPELLDSIRHALQATPAGTFIWGSMGVQTAIDPTLTRACLDSIAPNHPVHLRGMWGHVTVINTAAMQRLGITENAPDPKGGFYERTADGKLNGRLQEGAEMFAKDYKPFITDAGFVNSLKALGGEAVYFGITTIQNMCTSALPEQYTRLASATNFPVRLRLIRWGSINATGGLVIPSNGEKSSNKKLYIDGTKWLLDGTPLERLAALRNDYNDAPG